MTLVIEPEFRGLFDAELDAMFQFRHRIFVDMLGWEDIRRPDGRDIDAYDHEHAVYFVTIEDGEVLACSRLIPSLEPNICATQFARHADLRPIPRARDIYDYSRFAVASDRLDAQACNRLKALQVSSVFDYCQRRGITSTISFTLAHTLPQYGAAGVKTTPLGLPVTLQGSTYVSVHIDMRPPALDNVLKLFGMDRSPLIDPTQASSDALRNFG